MPVRFHSRRHVGIGHCHCIECISKFKQGPNPTKNPAWKPKCPQCGINIKNDQGIPLYLQFSDSLDATDIYIARAGDRIDSLDSKLTAEDTIEVGAILTKVVDAVVEKQAILTEKTVGVSDASHNMCHLIVDTFPRNFCVRSPGSRIVSPRG